MAEATKVIRAKCVETCFDSPHSVQYFTGSEVEFTLNSTDHIYSGQSHNFTDGKVAKFSRHLFWLKTLGGRWVWDFDRANSSHTALRIFFCKECGQPFNKFTEFGTHANEQHSKLKKHVSKTQADVADEAEELAIEKLLAEEEGDGTVETIDSIDDSEKLCECGKKLHHLGRCKGTPFGARKADISSEVQVETQP